MYNNQPNVDVIEPKRGSERCARSVLRRGSDRPHYGVNSCRRPTSSELDETRGCPLRATGAPVRIAAPEPRRLPAHETLPAVPRGVRDDLLSWPASAGLAVQKVRLRFFAIAPQFSQVGPRRTRPSGMTASHAGLTLRSESAQGLRSAGQIDRNRDRLDADSCAGGAALAAYAIPGY